MTIDDGLKLSVMALKKVLGNEFHVERIDGAYISTQDKKFKRVERERIAKIA